MDNTLYQMNTPSVEQQAVIDSIAEYNVTVDSVAGCGKTTTALAGCMKYPDRQFLIVTYNSKLRLETRARAESHNITNVEIHTYHSLCTRYYMPSPTDTAMRKVCEEGLPTMRDVPKFDVVVLDEQQDLDSLCFTFIVKFISENCTDPYIAVFGDVYQSIYGFKGADYRYLSQAPEIFAKLSTRPWKRMSIRESFRVTKPIATFINNHLLGNNRIVSNKEGGKVSYVIYNAFINGGIIRRISDMIKNRNYKPEDVFVLSYSVRSSNKRAPIKMIENQLVKDGYPCYVPINDDQELDDNVMKNKITISSFHQAKGRERKMVIVVGFDTNTYNFYTEQKKSPRTAVINAHYVACTRASEHLVVLHHCNNDYFPTVNEASLPTDVNILEDKPLKIKAASTPKPTKRGVTDVLRFMTNDVINDLMSHIKYTRVRASGCVSNVRKYATGIDDNDSQYEAISDLYGTAITLYHEIVTTKKIPVCLRKYVRDEEVEDTYEFLGFHREIVTTEKNTAQGTVRRSAVAFTFDENKVRRNDMLVRLCNYMSFKISGYSSRWKQITDYNWVDNDAIVATKPIIDNAIGGETVEYEKYVCKDVDKSLTLVGFIDMLSDNSLYEIKFTSETTDEHIIQMVLYHCLLDSKLPREMKLVNVREGYIIKIDQFDDPEGFVKKIVAFNNRPELKATQDEFDQNYTRIIDQVISGEKITFDQPDVEVSTVEPAGNADLIARLMAKRNKK